MRYIQGLTLSEAIQAYHEKRMEKKAGPLDLISLLRALVSVCNTLAYTHAQGVIHRDLKSLNIILGDFAEVMVVDWGFAKVLVPPEEEPSRVARSEQEAKCVSDSRGTPFASCSGRATQTQGQEQPHQTLAGQVFGTSAYMAPEQAAGQVDQIDRRTDVYSLGAILYEILTGRVPFTDPDLREVLRKVREEEAARPRQLCPSVPPALEAICLRAMAKKPENRYLSAADLARDVERWLADEPVEVYPEPRTARLGRWCRRHWPLVTAAAALFLTSLAGLAAGALLLGQEKARTAQEKMRAAQQETEFEARSRAQLETDLYANRVTSADRELAADNLGPADQLLGECPRSLRGWEWHYLMRRRYRDVRSLPAHHGPVLSLSFSPDNRWLASADNDGLVRIWEVTTRRLIRTLDRQPHAITGLAFSPQDSQILASVSADDGAVKIWNLTTGIPLHTFPEAGWQIAFSPDGRRLAAAVPAHLSIWDVTTGVQLQPTFPDAANEIVFSPDGRYVASGGDVTSERTWEEVPSQKQYVKIWDTLTGKFAGSLRGHTRMVLGLAYSPNGQRLASASWDGTVRLWDTATGQVVHILDGRHGELFTVAFSPDGKRLAAGGFDRTVKVWDAITGQELLILRGHTGPVRKVAFSPNGWLLASASDDGTVRIWDATPLTPAESKAEYEQLSLPGDHPFHGVAFSPDGRQLATASDDGSVRVCDAVVGHELCRLKGHNFPAFHVAYSHDGQRLAVASYDGTGTIWNVRQALEQGEATQPQVRFPKVHATLRCLAFSADDGQVAVAEYFGAVSIRDTAKGKEKIPALFPAGDRVAYSSDGRLLATAGLPDKTVKIWDAATGKPVRILVGHTDLVRGVAFSPDHRHIASAGWDKTVRVWEAATGKPVRILSGHTDRLFCVAYSPDGKWLASGGEDCTVRLWDAATGNGVLTLKGHTSLISGVAFSPDSKRLASSSWDKSVKVWDMDGIRSDAPTQDLTRQNLEQGPRR
jgi:WD40 repeat protein